MQNLFNKWPVLILGILFHLAYMMSIFDIYFVSPLVHGMQHFSSENDAPAQRLFLIVGDGLRADKCFEKVLHPAKHDRIYLAPYIRSKVCNDGTFGVSHTRVPTESRPGHVALIAGFYEDVSAVTKGWQSNPVDFDSVFNQSTHTWSWGSPDILPMFADGATKGRVDMYTYDHTWEDFTKGSIELDRFVFDGVTELFDEAKRNETLNARLHEGGIVFFLHLLGIDTAGHSYRPYSAEYYDNVVFIDENIKKLEEAVDNFYENDGQTAWVFTADHGMSDFGSHGDGHPNNTRTPIVAWGAGINKPIPGFANHDEWSKEWDLPVTRNDINQADIAPLMSYLLGVNYPANSVGELPLVFVNASQPQKARALAANAYSIAEQYLVKERQVARSQIHYKQFGPLSHNSTVELRKQEIERLQQEGDYLLAETKAEDLMAKGLLGLRYLQTYNWLLLRTLVTFGFLGWIAFAYCSFLFLFVADHQARQMSESRYIYGFFAAVFSILVALLYRQQSPWNYYLYAFFPVFFWCMVFTNMETLKDGTKRLLRTDETINNETQIPEKWMPIVYTAGAAVFIEVMVQGYFRRELYSLLLSLVIAPWPWAHNWQHAKKNWQLSMLWTVSSFALAICTVLPVVKIENLEYIVVSGLIMAALSCIYALYLNYQLKPSSVTMGIFGAQLGLMLLAVLVTRSSVLSLRARNGLPIGSQLAAWMTFGCSLAAPFLHSLSPVSDYRFRLLSIFMAFSPTMIILSISYEGFFYVAFFSLLFSWIGLELEFYANTKKKAQRAIIYTDFRRALVFFFFVHVGFFGTGNIASISSFSLDSVYRLIPVFSPFAMGALLIFKIIVPFVVLSVTLGIINLIIELPTYATFSMVLAISDFLSLNFFYMVVDEGSWLDIGTSISHFCICSLMCLLVILIETLSTLLVSGLEIPKSRCSSSEENSSLLTGATKSEE